MPPKTHRGTIYVKINDEYKPKIVEQKFTLIPNDTNNRVIPKHTHTITKKKSNKGGKGKKRRTYKKKRNSSYTKVRRDKRL